MAAMELDVPLLASFCSLPQTSIITLLDAPTVELVKTLLTNIVVKAREFDEAKSHQLKLNVELENAIRGGEAKSRVLKVSIEKTQKEAADLREKVQQQEKSRLAVEAELQALKTSTSASVSEITTLKSRISSLESSNRDTLSLLESKSTAYDGLAEELSSQHQKTVDLRREICNLEQSVQSANAACSSSKYHEQSLQQEIEQLKRNNDWLENELKTRSAEHAKYRKEKGARIAELQQRNDDATNSIETLNRTENILRKRLEEVSQKADDAFIRVQQMQEEASRRDEAFRVELDVAHRLAELMKNSASTEKARQKDLQEQLENAQEDASEQIGRLSAELENEARERQAAEQRVLELEVSVERLESDVLALQSQSPKPASSHQGINGHIGSTPETPSRKFAPDRFSSKSGLSLTQLVTDHNKLKVEFEAEHRRNEQLSSTIDDMIRELEVKQPEVEELRADHSRLESDVAEMSSLVDVIGKERDEAVKIARKQEGQVEAKSKEAEVLRQQLRDLSSQVKVLLIQLHLRDQGHDELSPERHHQLELLAQGQLDTESLDDMTDTDRFISQNLVTFKNIAELQEQNNNLIKVTREVGQRMEREEASRATREIDDLQKKYERCKDEVKSLVLQSQSFKRERDMLRRMLAHRGQLPPDGDLASIFGESLDGRKAPVTPMRSNVGNTVEESPSSRELSDYAKLLKDMQSHFDAYRHEAATDRSTLRGQVDNLSRANGELRSELARNSSQVTLAHERYEMLQANYVMLKTENEELQKRSQFFSDNAAKQELRVQQVVEDLVEGKGLADSMRNELANLKAEKDFWKSVEKRLVDDNETLSNERNRLNSLNASLQNLLNEREHSDTEARRRLSAQVEQLEKELQGAKRSLNDEVEENKRSSMRREYDQQHNQKIIDDLVASLSAVREEFVEARTTRDHLQSRVEEQNIELRSAEERIHLLQPTASNSPKFTNGEGLQDVDGNEENGFSKEQELGLLISDLRRDLELKKSELENAKVQIEQYKAISQSSEEQLQSLNETQDMFRQETDKVIEEKTAKVNELEARVDDLGAELASTTSELSTLRSQTDENRRRLEEQENYYEAKIAQLKDQDDRHAAAAQYLQEDLKAQAEIAQQAQQNYENELVKHAEAAKALQLVREQLNEFKLQAIELKTEADSARVNLSQNKELWAESRDRYENELHDIKVGKENLQVQNNRLHQQLENLSNQISNLQKHASSGEGDEAVTDIPTLNTDNLQEVIKYLRREKEIVDVQLELSTQEARRLKQQLDYVQSQLDETRLKLNQHRRLEEDNERSILNHNKLMETINELNTFRESSVTLRNESRQAQASLAAKVKEVEELRAQLEPLKAEIGELKNERDAQIGEMRLLKENSDRWQQRAQNILQKYDRIDPAELEALKEKLGNLEHEREELIASKQALQEEVDGIADKVLKAQNQGNEKVEELRSKLTEQFKTRSKNLSAVIKDRDAALQVASREKADLEGRLEALQNELQETQMQRDQAIEKASSAEIAKEDALEHSGAEEGQVDEMSSPGPTAEALQALREQLDAAGAQAIEDASRLANLQSEVVESQEKITELENEIDQTKKNLDEVNDELAQLRNVQTQQNPNLASNDELEEQLGELRYNLAQANARLEAESLRAITTVDESKDVLADESSQSVVDQVKLHVEAIRIELEARHDARVNQLEARHEERVNQLEARHDERMNQLEETYKKRTENMRNQLTKKLADGKDQMRQALAAEHEDSLNALRLTHQQEVEKLGIRHQDEIAELRRNEESNISQLKETWLREHPTSAVGEENTLVSEEQAPRSPWKLTEAETREFVSSNATVRSILRSNITTKVKEAKDALAVELKEEHEKVLLQRLKEVQDKAETVKEHAVYTEGKRFALKLNLADNRSKVAHAKLDVVQKAAQETPEKPVGEVWAIAKDAKPSLQASQISSPTAQNVIPAITFGQPTPITSGSPPTVQRSPPSMIFGLPASTEARANAQQKTLMGTTDSPIRPQNNQAPTVVASVNPTEEPQPVAQPVIISPVVPPPAIIQPAILQPTISQPPITPPPVLQLGSPHPAIDQPAIAQPTVTQPGSQSHLPVKLQPKNAQQQTSSGIGPGPMRGPQQSGLPIARGGLNRGVPNLRGRGQGIGRGGPQTLDTSKAQGPPAGAGGSMLSGGARQFLPQGNKRAREDGQDGQHGTDEGNGKRIRGGSAGP